MEKESKGTSKLLAIALASCILMPVLQLPINVLTGEEEYSAERAVGWIVGVSGWLALVGLIWFFAFLMTRPDR